MKYWIIGSRNKMSNALKHFGNSLLWISANSVQYFVLVDAAGVILKTPITLDSAFSKKIGASLVFPLDAPVHAGMDNIGNVVLFYKAPPKGISSEDRIALIDSSVEEVKSFLMGRQDFVTGNSKA